jgi:hypothetical protein
MASLLLDINSNTNHFVDLQCIVFKKLLIANADSEAINIDLAIGKSNSAGTTSLTEGANVLQAIKIPTGVTLCIEGLDFTGLVDSTAITGALEGDDYTLLIRATATDKLYNVFIDY